MHTLFSQKQICKWNYTLQNVEVIVWKVTQHWILVELRFSAIWSCATELHCTLCNCVSYKSKTVIVGPKNHQGLFNKNKRLVWSCTFSWVEGSSVWEVTWGWWCWWRQTPGSWLPAPSCAYSGQGVGAQAASETTTNSHINKLIWKWCFYFMKIIKTNRWNWYWRSS